MKILLIKFNGNATVPSFYRLSHRPTVEDKLRYLCRLLVTKKPNTLVNSNDEREKMLLEMLPDTKYLMNGLRMTLPTSGQGIIYFIRLIFEKGFLTPPDVSFTPFWCILDFYIIDEPRTTTDVRRRYANGVFCYPNQLILNVERTVLIEDDLCTLMLDNYFAITIPSPLDLGIHEHLAKTEVMFFQNRQYHHD